MISVITATYNHEKTLPLLYESLKNQTRKNFEWLICDDGSSDGTWGLINKYIKEKALSVRGFSQANKGMRLSKSINNGLKKAYGSIAFFVMGDTYLNDDTLEIMYDVYIDGSAGCGIRKHVTLDKSFYKWEWRYSGNDEIVKCTDVNNFARLTGNSMIVSMKDIERVGFWPEQYEGYGRDDWSVFLSLERAGVDLYQYNNVIVNHVYHGDGQPDNPKNIALFEKELLCK